MTAEEATSKFPQEVGIARYREPEEIAELMAFPRVAGRPLDDGLDAADGRWRGQVDLRPKTAVCGTAHRAVQVARPREMARRLPLAGHPNSASMHKPIACSDSTQKNSRTALTTT
jgi:hypothetical protein